jgi:hypothetical protein
VKYAAFFVTTMSLTNVAPPPVASWISRTSEPERAS